MSNIRELLKKHHSSNSPFTTAVYNMAGSLGVTLKQVPDADTLC